MKRLILITIFILNAVSLTWALDYTFFDVSEAFLKEINAFRADPVGYAKGLGIDLPSLPYSLPQVSLNEKLSLAAEEHLRDMVENLYFSHVTPDGFTPDDRVMETGYDPLIVGESLAYIAFENYISPEDAVKIFMYQLLKANLDCTSSEGAPLLFPYTDMGVSMIGVQLEVGEELYNLYVVCIVWGIPSGLASYVVVGRVYGIGEKELKDFCNEGIVKIIAFNTLYEIRTLCDGSFFLYNNHPDLNIGGFLKLEIFWHSEVRDVFYFGPFPAVFSIDLDK